MQFVRHLTAVAIFALSACSSGQGGADRQSAANDAAASASAAAARGTPFEKSFVASFHKEFVASCLTSATGRGLSETRAQGICTCGADTLVRDLSVAQLVALREDQVDAAMKKCTQKPE